MHVVIENSAVSEDFERESYSWSFKSLKNQHMADKGHFVDVIY